MDSFPSAVIISTVVELAIVKLADVKYLSSWSTLSLLAYAAVINAAIFWIYWALIFQQFITPLRHLPGPKVC